MFNIIFNVKMDPRSVYHKMMNEELYDNVYDSLINSQFQDAVDIILSYGGSNRDTSQYRSFLTKTLTYFGVNVDSKTMSKFITKKIKTLYSLQPFISTSSIDILTYLIFQFVFSHDVENMSIEDLTILANFLSKYGTSDLVLEYVVKHIPFYQPHKKIEIIDDKQWIYLLDDDV